MGYYETFDTLEKLAGSYARSIITQLNQGLNAYKEWQNFRAGRTNLEIATALSVTETEIADLDACFAALLKLYDYADNQVPTQADYFYSLRKFS